MLGSAKIFTRPDCILACSKDVTDPIVPDRVVVPKVGNAPMGLKVKFEPLTCTPNRSAIDLSISATFTSNKTCGKSSVTSIFNTFLPVNSSEIFTACCTLMASLIFPLSTKDSPAAEIRKVFSLGNKSKSRFLNEAVSAPTARSITDTRLPPAHKFRLVEPDFFPNI